MTLPKTLLNDGLIVSGIGFGAMSLSGVYGEADDTSSRATLHHALDAGVTLIDTADVYGSGRNETLVGSVLNGRDEAIILASKFGIVGARGTQSARADAAYVREAAEASLRRLGRESIDLYYMHRRDLSVPIEETVGAMAELVQQGKVRHLGLSEVTADELERAYGVHPIAAVQSEWSVWSRDVERAVVPTAARLGVGFVPYSPLGRGFLTGAYTNRDQLKGDWRLGIERFEEGAFETNLQLVRTLQEIAHAHDATAGQIALAWLRESGKRAGLGVVPIPGTRRAERVDENVASLYISLAETDMQRIDQLSTSVVGRRNPSGNPDWTTDTREVQPGDES